MLPDSSETDGAVRQPSAGDAPDDERADERAEVGAPGSIEVTEWRRYGHHRAIAARTDGTKIGFRDLITGDDHPADPADAAALAAAVDGWLVGGVEPPYAAPTEPVAPPVPGLDTLDHRGSLDDPGPLERDGGWLDLALNQPGSQSRARARAQRTTPGRSPLRRVLVRHPEERASRAAAKAEELVAAQLERLVARDPRWRVLHSVPLGPSTDIAHLAIGPSGVFSVNADFHVGKRMWVGGETVMVNGRRTPHVREARALARRAASLLSAASGFEVTVHGVVVPLRLQELVVTALPEDVGVVRRLRLAQWLLARPTVLSEIGTEAAWEHARRSTTWHR